jgi:magnesium-transporting ATPase (P-type)
MFIYKINIQSGNYLYHNYYISDLSDRHIDFDQWEFCVVQATQILFLNVLSAVPPFLSLCHKSKLMERKDRSQCRKNCFIELVSNGQWQCSSVAQTIQH